MTRVNEARFFTGFVAALRARGVDFVETQDDSHHARFNRVVQALREARANAEPGAQGMPRTLMPTQVTGRYRELDEALLNMQRGIFSAPNPYYPGVQLKLSEDRAERILDDSIRISANCSRASQTSSPRHSCESRRAMDALPAANRLRDSASFSELIARADAHWAGSIDAYIGTLPSSAPRMGAAGVAPVAKAFKDAIWGMVDLDARETIILDSPPLQRLRRVRQLGLSFLTYPTAGYSIRAYDWRSSSGISDA